MASINEPRKTQKKRNYRKRVLGLPIRASHHQTLAVQVQAGPASDPLERRNSLWIPNIFFVSHFDYLMSLPGHSVDDLIELNCPRCWGWWDGCLHIWNENEMKWNALFRRCDLKSRSLFFLLITCVSLSTQSLCVCVCVCRQRSFREIQDK